jgi:hypothetical protein
MRKTRFLKDKVILIFVSLIFCAATGSLLLPSAVRGSCRIHDISLEKVDNFTKVTVYADKPFEFVHSTLEEEGEKPYRVIIDCKDAIHGLPLHDFMDDLPPGPIKAIRTSQYQTAPEKMVRVVLDLDKPIIYKVIEKGEEGRGTIAILTTKEPAFPFWAAMENTNRPLGSELGYPSFVGKASPERSGVRENILITSSEKGSRFDSEGFENARGEKVERRTTSEKPLCFADTAETFVKTSVSMAKPETKKKDAEIKQKAIGQPSEERVLATTLTSPDVFSTAEPKQKELESRELKDKKNTADVEKDVPKSSVKQIGKKEYLQKEHSLSPKEATSSSTGETEKTTKTPPEESKTDSTTVSTKKGEVALLNPGEQSTKGKAGSPESLVVVSKPEGSAAEEVSKRKVVYYHDEGKRDPFVPLTERISTELGQIPLPKFETLKLVGVLKDEAFNRALLEDEMGYGYILKSGDKIKNGFVVSVEDDKITFQIQEYGWSKTMTLELSN